MSMVIAAFIRENAGNMHGLFTRIYRLFQQLANRFMHRLPGRAKYQCIPVEWLWRGAAYCICAATDLPCENHWKTPLQHSCPAVQFHTKYGLYQGGVGFRLAPRTSSWMLSSSWPLWRLTRVMRWCPGTGSHGALAPSAMTMSPICQRTSG